MEMPEKWNDRLTNNHFQIIFAVLATPKDSQPPSMETCPF